MQNLILLITGIFISLFAQSQTILLSDTNWFRKGPFCAHIQSLAMAPSNPDVIYLGTYSVGLYKTNNGGETWTYCSTENLPAYKDTLSYSPTLPCWWYGDYYPIDAIAIHPQDANHLWISTLERGLFESTNGGNSWQKANETLPDTLAVNFININPQNPDDIFLGTGMYFTPGSLQNGGLYRTLDGGNTWNLIESLPHGNTYNITDIKRDPTDNEHLIIGIGSAGEAGFSWGIMESFDDGNSWQEVMYDFPVYDISINPGNTQNIWGVVYTGYLDWWLEFSDDGGQNWSLYEGFEDPYKWVTSMYADADFNLYIERHTEKPDYTFSILKSTDNGASWFEVDKLSDKLSEITRTINLRNTCQAETSNTNNIYFGTYYGVFHSENGGITTQSQNTNLMNSYILDLEVHPNNSDIVYAAGAQGLWKSFGSCRSWERVVIDPVFFTKFNPLQPDTIYYGGRDPMRSYDGGITFQSIRHNIVGTPFDIAIHPVSTNIVYLTSCVDAFVHPLYKSTDYGDSWTLVFVSHNDESYTDILIDPLHPDTVYFGRHRSLNGGLTWEEDALELRIDGIHPQNSNTLFGSSMQGDDIQISYDWGSNFQLMDEYLSGQFPYQNIRNFTIAKDNPEYLFYCTGNDGIHYSNNSGNNWQKFEGLYENRTTEIIPIINENKFYIATHGDGVWVYDTTYTNAIDDNLLEVKDDNCLFVSPNPFTNHTSIIFNMKCSGSANISIYNLQGKLINTLINEYKMKGKYRIIWNGKGLNEKEVMPGLYLIRMQSGRSIHSHKVILLK